MAEKKICAECGQVIKNKKGGLLLPSILGTIVGVTITFIFNIYYFAGAGIFDEMPLIHLIAGFILGGGGGAIFGLAIRKR